MRIALITCSPLPEPDFDEAPLLEALRSAGHEAQSVAWTDPEADLGQFDAAVLRATWDYYHDLPAFLAWLDRAQRATTLLNPPAMVRANTHKGYLLGLEEAGVPIVPTEFVERGSQAELREIVSRRGWGGIVIKPAVGAGSFLASRFGADEIQDASDTFAAMVADRDTLVQAYVRSVETVGERSIVCLAGEVSHAVMKRPRFGTDDESVEVFELTGKETDFAHRVLAAMGESDRVLYARVDVFEDADGGLMLSEFELIEPSLFFAHCPGSADRFVSALERRMAERVEG